MICKQFSQAASSSIRQKLPALVPIAGCKPFTPSGRTWKDRRHRRGEYARKEEIKPAMYTPRSVYIAGFFHNLSADSASCFSFLWKYLTHDIQDRGKLAAVLVGAVNAAADGDEADALLTEEHFVAVSGLQAIASVRQWILTW